MGHLAARIHTHVEHPSLEHVIDYLESKHKIWAIFFSRTITFKFAVRWHPSVGWRTEVNALNQCAWVTVRNFNRPSSIACSDIEDVLHGLRHWCSEKRVWSTGIEDVVHDVCCLHRLKLEGR